MKKNELLNALREQQTKGKSTRRDYISYVADMVAKYVNSNAEIKGLSPLKSGYNLGDVMEVVIRSICGNNLIVDRGAKLTDYDATDNGTTYEVKFSTSDSYAHEINTSKKVDYYLIITATKRDGVNVYKIPFAKRADINVLMTTDKKTGKITLRPTAKQNAKYLNKEWTARLSPRA